MSDEIKPAEKVADKDGSMSAADRRAETVRGHNFSQFSRAFDDAVSACNAAFEQQRTSEDAAGESLENTLAVIYVQSEAAENNPEAFNAYLDEKGIRRHKARSVYHYMVELLQGATKAHNKSRYASAIQFLAEKKTPRTVEAAVGTLRKNGGPTGCADKMARKRTSQNTEKRGRRPLDQVGREFIQNDRWTPLANEPHGDDGIETGFFILIGRKGEDGVTRIADHHVQDEKTVNLVFSALGRHQSNKR